MRHPSTIGVEFRKPVCPKGHDKRKVGVAANHRCLVCERADTATYKRVIRARYAKVNPRSKRFAREIPNLREVRHKLGLTSEELASFVGIHDSSIRRIERGVIRATPQTTRRIVKAIAHLQKERV